VIVASNGDVHKIRVRGGTSAGAEFRHTPIRNVLKLRAEIEGQWGGYRPAADKYYDNSYYRLAIEKLK
jgi:hypothetical protein